MKNNFRIAGTLFVLFIIIISFQNFTIINEGTDFESQETSFLVDVDYGSISQALKKASERILPSPNSERCKSRPKNKYQCGELPYGKIMNANTKRLPFKIPIEKVKLYPGSGVKAYTKKVKYLPLFLSRHQRKGETKIASLDTLSQKNIKLNKYIADQLFLKLHPNKEKMNMSLCTNLPGFKVFSKKKKLHIFLEKRILWKTHKAKSIATINIGSLQVEASRVCADVLVDTKDGYFQNIEILKIHPPRYKGLKHSGLKVKVRTKFHSWFLRFAAKVAKIFGFKIKKMVSSKVKSAIKSKFKNEIAVTEADIVNGKWIKSYMEKYALKDQANKQLRRLTAELNKRDWYQEALKERITDICDQLLNDSELNINPLLIEPLNRRCSDPANIKANLFLGAENKKCYKYFFEPKAINNQWWADECHVRTRITLQLKEEDQQAMTCLSDTSRSFSNSEKFSLPESCKTKESSNQSLLSPMKDVGL